MITYTTAITCFENCNSHEFQENICQTICKLQIKDLYFFTDKHVFDAYSLLWIVVQVAELKRSTSSSTVSVEADVYNTCHLLHQHT